MLITFGDAMAAGNQHRVLRMLDFAAWCISDRSGRLPNDTSTAAICGFYEHLPKRREYWPLFRDWFSPTLFEALRPHLAYFLTDPEMIELVACYTGKYPAGGYRKNRSPRRIG